MGAIMFFDENEGRPVEVSQNHPLPVTMDSSPPDGSVGTDQLEDGSVTTEKIADNAVTDDKLANPKIDKPDPLIPSVVIGTTLSTNELGLVGYSQSPMADQLVMYQFGGQVATADPQADGDAATKKYVDDQVSGVTLSNMTMQEAQEGVLTSPRAISPQVLRAVMPSLSSIAMLDEGATLEECVAKVNEIIQTISP